jgi:Transposase DDE domain
VILWPDREAKDARIILVTNRVRWEVTRVVRVYRHRWTGTVTFHRDGKQQLGMGDCQLRTREGQTRHLYLVMLAYSLLVRQLRQGHAYEWAYQRPTTIGEACRAIMRETLRTTLTWAKERVQVYAWDKGRVVAHLGLTGDGDPHH